MGWCRPGVLGQQHPAGRWSQEKGCNVMFCKTAPRTSKQQQRRPKARRQAGPEFVAQALSWVDFHKPAVQLLRQQTADARGNKADPRLT